MILYLYDNNVESGKIANGKSSGSLLNDFLWDKNDNLLKQIDGSFYLRVNTEKYSKHFLKTLEKMYNYPGIYYLKCYYDTEPSYFEIKKLTVKDCKFLI